MAKISLIAAKYIINTSISAEGMIDKPDVIGAIFGQTEGLLGSDLELRELQRSGRIGRIEVELDSKNGKTNGKITIPSSLDKSETCIVGAALEVIQRIGPCNAKIKIDSIEDVRISKRELIINRAKSLLKDMMEKVLPDSQELSEEVASSVRVMEIQTYGSEKLPAGPGIEDAEEIIIVEGRADVITLLKNGFKNVIAMNGSSVPKTIIELSKRKIINAFTDGDRGGLLELRELLDVAEIDFVTRAPDGKEVEELTKKEIHKALRGKVAAEQMRLELHLDSKEETNNSKSNKNTKTYNKPNSNNSNNSNNKRKNQNSYEKKEYTRSKSNSSNDSLSINSIPEQERELLKDVLEDLIGTRGAYLLDKELNILGKVPITELTSTLASLEAGVYAVVFDGDIDNSIVDVAEKMKLKYIVGMKNHARKSNKVLLLSYKEL